MNTLQKRDWAGNVLLPLTIVVIGIIAYANSFNGPFIFDDAPNILQNESIRTLWPLTEPLSPPSDTGLVGRPILNLSFAINYALGEYSVQGYHIFNVIIHILASLAVYGIVRQCLGSERLKERFGRHGAILSAVIAVIWAVHPIQTESVTYIVQRAESLMGLFYLVTVYAAVKSMRPGSCKLWIMVSVVFCCLGIATKEVIATAPIIILLYDRTFVGQSFKESLQKRRLLYCLLAATWLLLAAMMVKSLTHTETIGFSVKGLSWFDYLTNQPMAIVQYLKLCFWPKNLCLYYWWQFTKNWNEILPSLLIVLLLLGITFWGFIRNKPWSYPWIWFFVILAPTSSIVPISDAIFEHRIYLSLAGLVGLVVIWVYVIFEQSKWSVRILKRRAVRDVLVGSMAAIVIGALTTATVYRNHDYRSDISIWESVVEANPKNYKAYTNLAKAYKEANNFDQAIYCYQKIFSARPQYFNGHLGLGLVYKDQGNLRTAVYHLLVALKQKPNNISANFNLADCLRLQGHLEKAANYYRKVLELEPEEAIIYCNTYMQLGMILLAQKEYESAIAYIQKAQQLAPEVAILNNNLAWALISNPNRNEEDLKQATDYALAAAELSDYKEASILDTLAAVYFADKQTDLAIKTAEKGLEIAKTDKNELLVSQFSKQLQIYQQAQQK